MDLFKKTPVLRHEKVAVPFVKMTAATDRWPQVLVQSLLQQVPYLQEFDLIPSITQLDAAQGYGFGFITVRAKTNRSARDLAGPKPVPHLRVPFVVKDWRLIPFDLFMRADKVYPMTEKRIREAMYSPEVFDSFSRTSPGDQSIAQDMMPPSEAHGSALYRGGNFSKMAKPRFLCEALAQIHVPVEDMAKIATTLKTDSALNWAYHHHEHVGGLLNAVHQGTLKEASVGPFKPDVVQVVRVSRNDFVVKAAQLRPFQVREETVPGHKAREVAGNFNVMKLADGGSYTVPTNPQVVSEWQPLETSLVKKAGWHSLVDKQGGSKLAYVFTQVFDLDGTRVREKLAHSQVDNLTDLQGDFVTSSNGGDWTESLYPSSDELSGSGFFYDPVTKQASVPFEVLVLSEVKGVPEVRVKTATGRELTLELVEGLHSLTKVAESRTAVPSHFRFVSSGFVDMNLTNDERVKLAYAPPPALEIVGDRAGVYAIRGPHVEGIDKGNLEGIKEAQALLMLGALGVPTDVSQAKLAYAREHSKAEVRLEIVKEASPAPTLPYGPTVTPPAVCLIKEAMEIDDADTVDKLLGLNFLRPENVQMYLDYLPELEDAVCKLGDLLMGVRVGLKPLSEDAVRRALFALEETLQGLRTLAQMGNNEAA